MHGYRRAADKEKVEGGTVDLEAGGTSVLYPGLSRSESDLRWGFVRKVYGIVAGQLLLTTAVSAAVVFYAPLNNLLGSTPGLLAMLVLPFILLCPLYIYRQKHPLNFVFLGLFTLFMSLSMGVICANTEGKIVLEALILTATVVASLTGYSFWAVKKGKEFSHLEPFLFSSLCALIVTGFIQMIFPLGSTTVGISGAVGAVIFSLFILYDTEKLIKRHSYDEYIWASVGLYLDIANLFIEILKILRSVQSDN